MLHRGITLIELLIAIAILLAIGAIATPFMIRTLDERRFESAAEQIEQQLLLARAYAQRTGSPVEVRYHPDTHRVIARRFMRDQDGDAGDSRNRRAGATRRPGARDGDFFSAFDDEDDDEASAITETWATRRVASGIELSDRRPQRTISGPRRDRANSELDSIPSRMAVYLPDGSAMLARTIWLTDNHDRIGRIRISAWTGTAKYERLPDITDDAPLVNDDLEDDDASLLRDALDFE